MPADPPWVESPTVRIDLNLDTKSRYDAARIPAESAAASESLLNAMRKELPSPALLTMADAVRLRTKNRFHAEFQAVARHSDVGWRELTLANISYDLVVGMFSCSCAIVETAAGPILARNMDWWPEDLLARSSVLLRYERSRELAFANAGWPGAVGMVTGMSGRGFGVALNAVSSVRDGRDARGYPVMLFLRKVVEDAENFGDAVQQLERQRLATACLLSVVGVENNERVCIERSANHAALRWGEPGVPLITTNDYRSLHADGDKASGSELFQTACNRYDGLLAETRDLSPDHITDDALLYALTSPAVCWEITSQHVIMQPRSNRIRLLVPRRFMEARTA